MRRTGFVISLALLSSTAMAQPGLLFDDFDSVINDEMGGMRELVLDVLSNPFGQNTNFAVDPDFGFDGTAGALVFNAGLAVDQVGTITWGGQNELNLDLSVALGLEMDFLQIDQNFQISIEATSGSESGSASWAGTVNATSTAKTEFFSFGDFSSSEGFNSSDVDSITIRFNTGEDGVSSLDFVLGEVRSTYLPAPASVAVLGLSGLLVSRRRRRG